MKTQFRYFIFSILVFGLFLTGGCVFQLVQNRFVKLRTEINVVRNESEFDRKRLGDSAIAGGGTSTGKLPQALDSR
jgi:hypothetical protein